MLSNIRIVLIRTWHAGNIGATARAMKNMGLSNLVLVDPVDFPSDEATSRAGQAVDLLEQANVVATLEEAIADCNLVIGTSARDRSIRLPALTAEACAEKACRESDQGTVAIVFGRERMGLSNEEIQQCHFQLNIATNPEYPVLNLSQAVQLVAWEVFKVASSETPPESDVEPYPRQRELEQFYQHLAKTSEATGFLNPAHPGQVMDHLRALFRRARPTRKELSILRGFLSSIDQHTSDR
ncbi:tRNA (cytosine(32)/uridine(32)-2'-O)-methyltransferase TrmJ [Reinekea blandensis]|uniref:tRNA (cytidine/uridine-2'-O-)-methyltransferase TrmJ n=1 Tax=Reinekea blandensis MED297 TaxID=314283 RepID=A4BBL3_9GAMM|nr:tRNA (cytosine(32)/uridine(32)-2'-O)-methyltransferase TrmJ [Reinekea blandensis]EAR10348.1 rRNA methyltransferase, TrmH family protein [Reinekea sp. MED297] [Reinekea blandensis MED297]